MKPTAVKDIREGPISDFGDNTLGRSFVGTPYENEDGVEVTDVFTYLTENMVKFKKLDLEKECVDALGKPAPRTYIFTRTYLSKYILPPQDFIFPNSGKRDRKFRILCGFNSESTPSTRVYDDMMWEYKVMAKTIKSLKREIIGLTKENEVLRTKFWAKVKEYKEAFKREWAPKEDDEHGGE